MQDFIIRKIKENELDQIQHITPPDWDKDIVNIFRKHYNKPYYYPIGVYLGEELAGTGMVIIYGNTAWLGMIIVKDSFRKKGIGNKIVNHLIDYSKNRGAETVLLTATEMGFPVYRKIGFEADIKYIVFDPPATIRANTVSQHIQPITEKDYSRILEMDLLVTGEDRSILLKESFVNGFKCDEGTLQGYYLPDFEKGLVIAVNDHAGVELLKKKLAYKPTQMSLPETNQVGINFLLSQGYTEAYRSPRMFLGNEVSWKPTCIYSRGSAYSG